MKQCKEINELLHLFVSDELNLTVQMEVKEHLSQCSECKEKYKQIQIISQNLEKLRDEADSVFEEIQWSYEPQKLMHSIKVEKSYYKSLFWSFSTGIAYSLILVFTISLFLFVPETDRFSNHKQIVLQHDTISNMEAQLDRGDIIKSLSKGSMLINDFMKQCNSSTEINYMFREQQVKKLLAQNRYLIGNLNSKNMVSAKKIIGQINYLLYEMSSLSKNGSCKDVKPIQDFVKERKLLLKIKLIKDELIYKEIS